MDTLNNTQINNIFPFKIELHKRNDDYWYKFINEKNEAIEYEIKWANWYSEHHGIIVGRLLENKINITKECPYCKGSKYDISIPISYFIENHYLLIEEILSAEHEMLCNKYPFYSWKADEIEKFYKIQQIAY